jgi:hypothetical protein
MDAQIHQPRRAAVRGDEDSEPPQGRGGLPKVGGRGGAARLVYELATAAAAFGAPRL